MKLKPPPCESCGDPADYRVLSINHKPFVMAACRVCLDVIAEGFSYEAQSIFEDPGQPLNCDFCLLGRPTWEFPVPDFQMIEESGIHNMTGNWLACDECKTLILTKDLDGLEARCMELYEVQHGYRPSTEANARVKALWGVVFERMEGDPWPLSQDQR